MKIWINAITQKEIRDEQEKDADFNPIFNIKGQLFIPGEWVHLPDTFTVDAVAYPYIKEAHIVLQEKTKQVLEENGLNAFAQGLKEAATVYGTAVPAVASDVQKYAPYVAKEEAEVEP